MLTRMYKVIQDGKEKYFENEEQAKSLDKKNEGSYVHCYYDKNANSYHQVTRCYSGNKSDKSKSIKAGNSYYGGGESLEVDEIRNFSDGIYPACLTYSTWGDDDYSAGTKIFKLRLDPSGKHYAKKIETGDYTRGATYGYVLQINHPTYILYAKENEFLPEPAPRLASQSSLLNKFSLYTNSEAKQESQKELPVILSSAEQAFLDEKVQEAQEKAMEEIFAARLRGVDLSKRVRFK